MHQKIGRAGRGWLRVLQNDVGFVQHRGDGGRRRPQPPRARLPGQGWDQLFTYREAGGIFLRRLVCSVSDWVFNSNTKRLEQIDFAAPVFIMQEELSLIR